MNNNIALLYPILLIMAFLLILCFSLCLASFSKCNKLKKLINQQDLSGIEEAEERIRKLISNIPAGGETVATQIFDSASFNKFGIVRFDAFPGMSGSFSYSLAVLNGENNGFVITTMYGHDSSNTYLREIKNATSDIKLLPEEEQAINKAQNTM